MKQLFVTIFLLFVCVLAACGAQPAAQAKAQSQPAAEATQQAQEQTAKPAPDLTGEWSSEKENGSYMTATIAADTIEIFWMNDEKGTKALYWAGSFTPPATGDEPYTWESVNDKEKTGKALLASNADTKQFSFENGEITYEAAAMGVTKIVHLKK